MMPMEILHHHQQYQMVIRIYLTIQATRQASPVLMLTDIQVMVMVMEKAKGAEVDAEATWYNRLDLYW
jgi:hypothetical protein